MPDLEGSLAVCFRPSINQSINQSVSQSDSQDYSSGEKVCVCVSFRVRSTTAKTHSSNSLCWRTSRRKNYRRWSAILGHSIAIRWTALELRCTPRRVCLTSSPAVSSATTPLTSTASTASIPPPVRYHHTVARGGDFYHPLEMSRNVFFSIPFPMARSYSHYWSQVQPSFIPIPIGCSHSLPFPFPYLIR